MAPAALARMARHGQGYIGGSMPAAMVVTAFDGARAAWRAAGRDGNPRLVAIAYFALGDPQAGRRNVYDYYSITDTGFAEMTAAGTAGDEQTVRTVVKSFEEIGADELILNPAGADLDDIERLASIVL